MITSLESNVARKTNRRRNKVGRNDKCPCGSGKKYKRCCLGADERRQSAKLATAQPPLPPVVLWDDDEDEFERTTNGVIDLIEQGKFDDAERSCEELRRKWPKMIDWMDRLALVRDAQGRYAEAAALNRQAAEFARTNGGFDDEGIQWYLEKAARQEEMAAAE